jgi:(2Fe-2S) ferredoxin
MDKPKHHIFICASTRLNGKVQGVCEKKNSHQLIQLFSEEINDRGLSADIMVSSMGCVGLCDNGPVVMIYPQQTWYGQVEEDDVEEILDAIEGDTIVERLAI